jgi:hypothetical protein
MGESYKKEWVVPVVKDLQAFLSANGQPEGAKALEDALAVINREMLQSSGAGDGLPKCVDAHFKTTRRDAVHLRVVGETLN